MQSFAGTRSMQALALACALSAAFAMPARAQEEPVVATPDPTVDAGAVDTVYQIALAGHPRRAQRMLTQLLQEHPDSAPAHYAQAELFALDGQVVPARKELGTAERLAPGLPFVTAESVLALQRELAKAASRRAVSAGTRSERATPPARRPLSLALAIGAGAMLAWLVMRIARPSADSLAPPARGLDPVLSEAGGTDAGPSA